MTFQTFHYDLLIQLATACCLLLFLTSTTTAFTTNQPYYYANTIAKSPAAILRTTSIHNTPFVLRKSQYTPSKFNCFTRLFLSSSSTSPLTEPDLQSNDPFRILGLDPNHPEALDKKVIKRAYKKMALKYHPDVTTTRDSTPEEKRQAGDTFAKINAAYQTLSSGNVGASASSSRSSSGSSTGWEPPHRRSGGYQSRRGSDYSDYKTTGTTWEDFMPKYNDEDYDAGGDSFAAIFSDLLAGAAGAAAGYGGGSRGGGIFTDFVEFLEQNIEGYGDFTSTGVGSATGGQDADLTYLLQTGSIQEVGEELDETELVVQQLSSKLSDLQSELLGIKADLAAASKFSEKIKLEEQQSECMARTKVVEKYLAQARKRLLKLQTRYKELIVGGANDFKAGGGTRDRSGYGGSNYSSGSGYSNSNARASTTSSTSSSTSSTRTTSTDPENAWKSEGFGSSGGRGRGSSRRRGASAAGRRTTSSRETVNNSQSSSSSGGTSSSSGTYSSTGSNTNEPSRRQSTYSSSSTSSSGNQPTSPRSSPSPSPTPSTDYVPPHRRSPSYDQRVQDDKKRLRELQVEDEFQKLKKELGL